MSDTIPQDTPQKQCSKCKQFFPATPQFFTRDKTKPGGWYSSCKNCCRTYHKRPDVIERERKQRKEAWQALKNDPEKLKAVQERQRVWAMSPEARAHKMEYMYYYYRKPEVQQRVQDYGYVYRRRPEVKARIQAYTKVYQRTPASRKRQLAYRNRSKAHINRYQAAYYIRKRETIRAYAKLYQKRPETRLLMQAAGEKRRMRKKSIRGTHSVQQIKELLRKQKHRCYYCRDLFKIVKGKHLFHIDHTFPVSRVVGTDIPANDISYLVLACPTCNLKKGDKFPWEWPEGGRLL